MFRLTPIGQRRWRNFKANRRGWWSLWIFLALFLISLFAEVVANDKPLVMSFKGELHFPMLTFYPETYFGGDFGTEPDYTDPFVQDLIRGNGDGIVEAGETPGWMIWPLIPFSYDTPNYEVETAPAPPSSRNWLGTDDQTRDVLARVIYGFRISVLFGFSVTILSSLIGVLAGATQGFFGGWVDLFFQRVVEIWGNIPTLYVLIIVSAVITPNFWILMILLTLFSWTALVGVVRAEFLRARNFEYVRAARALGVSDWPIMFRHLLPNAMVATLTFVPFLLAGSVSILASLDFLGFGLPADYPSLGDLALQGKNNLQAPWLGVTAFLTFAIMLSLLVFIFEAVRDAFDPRKTFS
ncbi:ABC transporter permease [Pikeienuella sp. HZG-20]|uniref:ABC transporter permease n=1 Tax=Paludibacillus litoralis TaxID=3133267 RepID=UPI0030EFA210